MRRNWLAGAAAAAAITIPVTALSGTALGGTAQAATVSQQMAATTKVRVLQRVVAFNQSAAAVARRLVGDPYVYGGSTPAGFDCSGLAQYVYRHAGHGRSIQRTAEAQYLQFRRIARSAAKPGDLVFFHDTSSPSSYVYHVGVFEGGVDMVAATTPAGGVKFQSFTWGGNTVTFGTITH